MANDSLGDRIKRYEYACRPFLTPNMPVLIRVDGKAFHTWTKGFDRPFDYKLVDAMVMAARNTAREVQGFKLAYVQSDEATFLITDTDRLESQPWLDYNVNKIVSVTASVFTAHFNKIAQSWQRHSTALAFFDARAFNVPFEDAANVFIWRQRDWERNSLMMLARSHFSHKSLNGKKKPEVHEMLHGVGVNWADLDPQLKNGTFVTQGNAVSCQKLTYTEIDDLIRAPVPSSRDAGTPG